MTSDEAIVHHERIRTTRENGATSEKERKDPAHMNSSGGWRGVTARRESHTRKEKDTDVSHAFSHAHRRDGQK